MFEVLSEKLNGAFLLLGNRGKLTEKDSDDALRQVRLALLEADVNFKVVKNFTTRVRERSLGAEVLESLTPAQQIIKIVNEEPIATLGDGQSSLASSSQPPTVVMLVGLQGSGIWSPSGIVQASHEEEELLVIRNVEIRGHMRHQAKEHFDYRLDFDEVYRKIRDMKPKQVFFGGR